MRGRDAQGKKKRWSATRKEKDLLHMIGPAARFLANVHKAKDKEAASSAPGKANKTKRRHEAQHPVAPATKKRKKARAKAAEIVRTSGPDQGDVLVEADFDASEDEEEIVLQKAAAERRQLAAEKAAKGMRQIYVGGIPWTASKEAVTRYFEKCGAVVEIEYPLTPEGKPRGYAFVTFQSEEVVAKALGLDKKDYEGRQLSVQVVSQKGQKKGKGKGKKGRGGDSDDDSGTVDDWDDDSGSGYESDDRGKGKGKGKTKGKSKGKGKGKGKGAGKGMGKDNKNKAKARARKEARVKVKAKGNSMSRCSAM